MRLPNPIRALCNPFKTKRRHQRQSFSRPRLEPLEDRCLLSTANIWSAAAPVGAWSVSTNWSLGHMPTSMEIATFDNTSQATCVIDTSATASGINIASTHTGMITAGADVTLGADGFVQAGGIFSDVSFTITDAGNFSENSAAGFNAGTGTVDFNGDSGTTQLLDSGGSAFNNLIHSGAGTLQLMTNALTVNGTLTNNAGTFDANNLNLTVGGLTSINAGTMQNSNSGFIHNTLTLSGSLNIMSATLDVGNGKAVLGGDLTATPSSSTFPIIKGNLDLGGGHRTFTVNTNTFGQFVEIEANIQNGSLTKDGPGFLDLGGFNSFTGGTIVAAGTLAMAADTAMGTVSLTLNDGTTAELDAQNTNILVSNPIIVNGSAALIVGHDITLTGTLTLNGNVTVGGGFLTLSGTLTGPGGITIAPGSTNLILTLNSAYSGTITLNGGFLFVTGSVPNSPVIVNSGTLLGNGTIGPVTVNGGGVQPSTLFPNEPGILTTGNLQFNGGGLDFAVNGTVPGSGYSQLRVNGTVNLGNGVASIQAHNTSFAPIRFDYGTKLQIIANLGGMPVTGFFKGGSVITDPDSNRYDMIYGSGSSNDVVAMAVPRFDIAGRVSNNGPDPGRWQFGVSDGSSFTSSNGPAWSTAVTWVDVHTGDFTGTGDFPGNGLQSIVGRVKETGQWWTSVPNGSGGFTSSLWDTWNPGVTWVDVKVGDFNGDGKIDIVGRALETGQWWVAQSTGSSFTNGLWASWNPNVTWVGVQVGDFNGDGKADITGRWLQGGSWWTGISNGSVFSTAQWAQWNPAAAWVDVNVGDFNGDGKADIVGRWLQGCQWWVAQSTGSSFTNSLWATWSPAVTWVDVKVGDFNGDGKADITGRWLQGGSWWTAISNGSAFSTSQWAQWSTTATWVDVQVGDFNGDGKMDITGRWLQGGSWWTAVSNGTSFATTQWTQWSTAVTWVDVQNGVYV